MAAPNGPRPDKPVTVVFVVVGLIILIAALVWMDWQDVYGEDFYQFLFPVVMVDHFQPEYPTMQPLPTAICSPQGECGTLPYPIYELGPDDLYWCTVVLDPKIDPCQQTWLVQVIR
jgi:hypothetical protein